MKNNNMRSFHFLTAILILGSLSSVFSQSNGLINTSGSPYARLSNVGLADVQWTDGFWAERFEICKDSMIPSLWATYTSDTICYSFHNFKIAAGLEEGRFRGPTFHDGDFYKTMEAVASMYASTEDRRLYDWLEEAIGVIGKAQREDGYIYTKNLIEERRTGEVAGFGEQVNFEAYNFGHLMTAASIHYRATGQTNLLDIARKASDYLISFYDTATPDQARMAICPSHYMGLAELYRTTNEDKYLKLLSHLVDIRGEVEGTDDNSDRAPFREMRRIAGHAVRANYLMAGVADLYAETGDESLLFTLDTLWRNIVQTKMYVTGGCGALYDGVSVDGTSYRPDTVQKVHQSYGRDYQLPNFTAHNETCANIGNVLWNYRMFLLTGEEKYMNIVELALYNSVLSGVSMDGKDYFYTNPLAHTTDFPYKMRWEGGRIPYISRSNCCPPNTVRTIAEVSNYMYSVGDEGLYMNLYGGNHLSTRTSAGEIISLNQVSNYPWDGRVEITVEDAPSAEYTLHLRIPGWCKNAMVTVNGDLVEDSVQGGQYFSLERNWKKGDRIELVLEMPAVLLESNPLVEETRNQVAVKRGPVVYCIESPDLEGGNIFNVAVPADIRLTPVSDRIAGGNIMALTGTARLLREPDWTRTLYREVSTDYEPVRIKLIPYYAWANRGYTDMSVWMPLIR